MTRQRKNLAQIRRARRVTFKRVNSERRLREDLAELKSRYSSRIEIERLFYEDLNKRITQYITPQTTEIIQKTATAIREIAGKLSDAVIAHFVAIRKS